MYFIMCIIAMFSSIIAGMGVGGGSIFILLTTIFNIFNHKEAQWYNLVMFVSVGIFVTASNFINNKVDKNKLKKLIIPVCIGSIIGIIFVKIIDENILKKFFYLFMLVIGIYEIFSSLKNIKSAKNKNNERS